MNLSEKASLVIYRLREKGLEVFLVNSSEEEESWSLPQGKLCEERPELLKEEERLIELDPIKKEDGEVQEALAVAVAKDARLRIGLGPRPVCLFVCLVLVFSCFKLDGSGAIDSTRWCGRMDLSTPT